uniref:Uncharacterized protein n=1 Tax=Rousettus aegyptiacus TaxID=9407 RepID=A0A7J8E8T3_ROUAE|nr:hypothetical protein HJG63_008206 [Rousettus aegyptiacus]
MSFHLYLTGTVSSSPFFFQEDLDVQELLVAQFLVLGLGSDLVWLLLKGPDLSLDLGWLCTVIASVSARERARRDCSVISRSCRVRFISVSCVLAEVAPSVSLEICRCIVGLSLWIGPRVLLILLLVFYPLCLSCFFFIPLFSPFLPAKYSSFFL